MTVTLKELEDQLEEALSKARTTRLEKTNLGIAYDQGLLDAAMYQAAMVGIDQRIKRWDDEVSRLQDAIASLKETEEEPPEPDQAAILIATLLGQMRSIDEKVRAGVILYDPYLRSWDTLIAQLRALGYAVETLKPVPRAEVPEEIPPIPPEEPEELKAQAEAVRDQVISACIARGTYEWACVGYGRMAYDAVMAGETPAAAKDTVEEVERKAVEEGPLAAIGGLLGSFGNLGDLMSDSGIASMLAAPITTFMDALGLGPKGLEAVMASPMDRDKAAQIATGVSIAAQTGLGILYSIGVLTEIGSMGQVDTLVDVIDNTIRTLGIDEIIRPLFTAPSYAALTIPVRQYWMSVFKPTIPPIEDLRLMAVREAFPVETREEQFAEMGKWAAYHGLDEYWRDRYLTAGYERMDVRTALDMFYWRLWDEKQLKAFLSIADIHPDDHNSIISTLWRSPTRYERRHGYIMGVYDEEDLEKYFHRDGLSDGDSKTATVAMTAYALNAERNAVARAAGRIYRETLEAIGERLADLEKESREALDDVVAMEKLLEAGEDDVTGADVEAASLEVADIQARLGGLKKSAADIRAKAEAELRVELTELKVTADRQDLWVKRYAMEAKVKTRPWELIEEAGPFTTVESLE